MNSYSVNSVRRMQPQWRHDIMTRARKLVRLCCVYSQHRRDDAPEPVEEWRFLPEMIQAVDVAQRRTRCRINQNRTRVKAMRGAYLRVQNINTPSFVERTHFSRTERMSVLFFLNHEPKYITSWHAAKFWEKVSVDEYTDCHPFHVPTSAFSLRRKSSHHTPEFVLDF